MLTSLFLTGRKFTRITLLTSIRATNTRETTKMAPSPTTMRARPTWTLTTNSRSEKIVMTHMINTLTTGFNITCLPIPLKELQTGGKILELRPKWNRTTSIPTARVPTSTRLEMPNQCLSSRHLRLSKRTSLVSSQLRRTCKTTSASRMSSDSMDDQEPTQAHRASSRTLITRPK